MDTALDEMYAVLNGNKEEVLMHYGKGHLDGGHSGRYPWGTGEDAYQHGTMDFLGRVEKMRKENPTYTDENGRTYTGDTAIAKMLGLSTTQLRTEISISKDERRLAQVSKVKQLAAEGKGASEIGKEMGINESTVRSLLNANSEARMKKAQATADFLRKEVDEKTMVDIGTGAERELNISKEKLNQAIYMLERDGYHVYTGRFEQATNPGQWTTQKVLARPEVEYKEIYELDRVKPLKDYISRDDGETFERKFTYPESLNSDRLMIRYKEDGGIEKDGLVEIRRGCEDLSLGESRYSQVRIMVDGKKYIKGMAVYGKDEDFPDGVDVIFNTNKGKDKSKLEVLKDVKSDPDNPFGSLIKDADQGGQYWYTDSKTGEKKLGLINKRADEGDWDEWKDALPSQFLSKQSLSMINKQLSLAKADKYAEYDEICSLTNPTIKKHLLEKFSDECDSAAVHLQAAALPGQKYHVILPVPEMKDTEVYAPNYENGTQVALIRYPHGGTFEIPILTVNNKQPNAKDILGTQPVDAVCINSKVAERLSGADFDGDTVMVIPTHDPLGKVKITSTPRLKELEGFDPKMEYPERPGMKYMKDPKTGSDSTQMQMGSISNLITDMTLAGAPDDELARAVKHSMVVIDAGKHKLDYKQSEIDNDIHSLKVKYQKHVDENGNVKYGGASTIISAAKGQVSVAKRQGTPYTNLKGKEGYDPTRPEGALIYKNADDLYYPVRKYDKSKGLTVVTTVDGKRVSYDAKNKEQVEKYEPVQVVDPATGKIKYTSRDGTIDYKFKTRLQPSTKMAETDDAMTLVSPSKNKKELAYASYANSMKSLANEARKELAATGKIEYSRQAATVYKSEVESLKAKLNDALLNAPKERAAQRQANYTVSQKIKEDPTMKPGDIRKASQRALTKARSENSAISRRERNIQITDREWEAIQAGAISESKLKQILNNTDTAALRQRATPKATSTLSEAKVNRAKALSSSNYTLSEIAKALGVSTSTVSKYLKGVN